LEDKQKNKTGEYFRNNCWWWRPLATYVLENIDLPEKQQDWFMNNGCKVSKVSAEKIAKRIKELIDSGEAKKYEIQYKKEINALEKINCNICEGTGKRKNAPEIGAGKIKCNGCNGTGKTDPWPKSYPFSVENLKEFMEFAESSGGFEIC